MRRTLGLDGGPPTASGRIQPWQATRWGAGTSGCPCLRAAGDDDVRPFDGSLFAEGFLREAITELPGWDDVSASALDDLEAALQARFDRFPTDLSPNESQTEEDLIWPVLEGLGWTAHLKQQNLSPTGRQDVPDGLLFADDAAKDRANRFADEWKRYGHGVAVVESKAVAAAP